MKPFLRPFLFALGVAVAAVSRVAAAPLPDEEAQKIQGVIVAQLDAFAFDDADGAFAAATPAVREAIGEPALFLALVRGVYPMVYHPAAVTFHPPEQEGDAVLQAVEITDEDDRTWMGLFAVEKQPDSSWRVRGCAIAETRWQSI